MIGTIYKIYSTSHGGLIYIGSTFDKIQHRLSIHLSEFKRYQHGKSSFVSLYEIFEKYSIDKIIITKLHEYDVVDKKELKMYEAMAILHARSIGPFTPINRNIPFSIRSLYMRKYRKENKQKLREYSAEYRMAHGQLKTPNLSPPMVPTQPLQGAIEDVNQIILPMVLEEQPEVEVEVKVERLHLQPQKIHQNNIRRLIRPHAILSLRPCNA